MGSACVARYGTIGSSDECCSNLGVVIAALQQGDSCVNRCMCVDSGNDPYGSWCASNVCKNPDGCNLPCCDGSEPVQAKWSSDQCSYQCRHCLEEGGDINEHCGVGCDESACQMRCCAGLSPQPSSDGSVRCSP